MTIREILYRYSYTIYRLKKSPCTFNEIADYLDFQSEQYDYDLRISKRTFQRITKEIDALFGIEIKYDHSAKVYKIIREENAHLNDFVLDAFNTLDILNYSNRLGDKVHFETRKPNGSQHLMLLLKAIDERKVVFFNHKKHWEKEITDRKIEPYALKESKNRWYLVGKRNGGNHVVTFGLDRISNLKMTKTEFVYPEDFDVSNHFENSFGIVSSDDRKVHEVILGFKNFQANYPLTLPLHHSQEALGTVDGEVRIKLKLYITRDFEMEILSYGAGVRVIEPAFLRDKMKHELQQSMEYYT